MQRESAAAEALRRVAQRETADNARFKAELLRLKKLHNDVSVRAQQLQRELFNSQQETVQRHTDDDARMRAC